MLYSLIQKISVLAIKLFFNQISIQNKQIVTNTSPIIFVANHPNFFMDPLIIGSYCPRQLYFFAKSTLFNSPLKKRILTRLNLVPVYRKTDDKENMGGNINSFNKGYKILENNGAFLIFPEGISVGKRVLEKIKTEAARIGLEAELKNDFALNIVIIPIGLSYSDQVRFRSNIMIRFGNPIELSKFEKEYKTNEVETVKKVTLIIEKSLKGLKIIKQGNQTLSEIAEQIKDIDKFKEFPMNSK